MAKQVIRAKSVTLEGTDYSGECNGATLPLSAPTLEAGTFGDGGAEKYEISIKANTMTLNTRPGADNVFLEQLLQWYASGEDVTVVLRQNSGAASATNLQFTFEVKVTDCPIGGDRGSLFEQSVTWPVNGTISMYDGTTTTDLCP